MRLETKRLVIRNFRISDWKALHEMIKQYVSSGLAAYEPNQWPTGEEEIKKITEWFASGDSYFAVCFKDQDRLIGLVALNQEQGKESNLGYIFNFNYHGKGYATEACQALLDYSFTQLQLQRIVTGTATENIASVRLLERLGFRRTESQRLFELTREDRKTRSGLKQAPY
jgi:RimJ/RimL family protein N-acetyltransferase